MAGVFGGLSLLGPRSNGLCFGDLLGDSLSGDLGLAVLGISCPHCFQFPKTLAKGTSFVIVGDFPMKVNLAVSTG